jgi:DNA-binding transcriptional ArsR family regulator
MSSRILEVLKEVAMFGPASLDEICEKLPRTRSTVYRALKALEVDGWIRRSLNGRSFLISRRMERLADCQFNMSDNITEIIDIFRIKLRNQRLLPIIDSHINNNNSSIMDSNVFPIPTVLEYPYRRDMLSNFVAAISVSGTRTLNNRSAWQNEKSKFREISTGIREEGYVISNEFELRFLPVLIGLGNMVIVMIENKSHSNVSLGRIKNTIEDLVESLKKRNASLCRNDENKRLLAG